MSKKIMVHSPLMTWGKYIHNFHLQSIERTGTVLSILNLRPEFVSLNQLLYSAIS